MVAITSKTIDDDDNVLNTEAGHSPSGRAKLVVLLSDKEARREVGNGLFCPLLRKSEPSSCCCPT